MEKNLNLEDKLKKYESDEEFNVIEWSKLYFTNYLKYKESNISKEESAKLFKNMNYDELIKKPIDHLSYNELNYLNNNFKTNYNFIYGLFFFNGFYIYYSKQFIQNKYKSFIKNYFLKNKIEKNIKNMYKYNLLFSTLWFVTFGLGNFCCLYPFDISKNNQLNDEIKNRLLEKNIIEDENSRKIILGILMNTFKVSKDIQKKVFIDLILNDEKNN